jgi:hypothetical protein
MSRLLAVILLTFFLSPICAAFASAKTPHFVKYVDAPVADAAAAARKPCHCR